MCTIYEPICKPVSFVYRGFQRERIIRIVDTGKFAAGIVYGVYGDLCVLRTFDLQEVRIKQSVILLQESVHIAGAILGKEQNVRGLGVYRLHGSDVLRQSFQVMGKLRIPGGNQFLGGEINRFGGEGIVHQIADIIGKHFAAVRPLHQIAEDRRLIIV